MSEVVELLSFDLKGIQMCQRNRYPVLFIDRAYDVVPGKSARGLKNFTYNEWFFPAHFDDDPNVPGFIQMEALAQTFLMTFLCIKEYQGMKTNSSCITNVAFKRKIVPGDRLDIAASLGSFRRGVAKGRAESFVDGEPACSLDIVVVIPEVLEGFRPRAKG